MGLRNLFFEEVEKEPIVEYTSEIEEIESTLDVDTSNLDKNAVVPGIYQKNGLDNMTQSIFKAEEIINSLPKEMPNGTKRTTVLSILSSFGLSEDVLIKDAYNRTTYLTAAFNEIKEDNEKVITENEVQIEAKKIEISELEKNNAELHEIIRKAGDEITSESDRINGLIKFITGE